ncbi:MAG: hypothetical protein IJR60_03040 [Eubacterium sp.]|nr:hypothetical protein [Eubacterium sp.]
MKTKVIAQKYNLNQADFEDFLRTNNLDCFEKHNSIDVYDYFVEEYVAKYNQWIIANGKNNSEDNTDIKQPQESVNKQNGIEIKMGNSDAVDNNIKGFNYKTIDIIVQINSIRTMGLMSIVIAFLNPIIGLVCGTIGKARGERLTAVPSELDNSLTDAVEYNEKGVKVSSIILVIEIIVSIIGAMIALNQ